MLKRFARVIGVMASMAVLVAACSGGNTEENPPEQTGLEGEAQVSVKGLSAWQIESMVLTAQPANVSRTLTYLSDAGTFVGTLVLPTGTQTLTANGYAYVVSDGGTPDGGPGADAGSSVLTLVASGSSTIQVQPNVTTAVSMRIYDQTPPPAQPDIAPVIRAVTASNANATVNQPITVRVDAVDIDGDALSYLWTSDCVSGSFDQRTAPTTIWSSSAPGACTLSVAVSSRGLTVSESVAVVVFPGGQDGGTGGAQVNGEYIPRPQVHSLAVYSSTGEVPYAPIYRYYPTANLPTVRAGQQYYVEFETDFGTRHGSRSTNLEFSCGTATLNYDTCEFGGFCRVNYLWTAPSSGAACRVTATASNDMLSDSFSAGILVR
ncbi:hypothetical protein ACLESO_54825 [Pyxidicoccus sp. 3LG]